MKKLIKEILKNNSGISVKSLVALWGIIVGSLIVLLICIIIIYNITHSQTVDYQGIAILLGATAALVVSSSTLKIFGEKYETRYRNNYEHDNYATYETHETNYNIDINDDINSGM
jgi:glucan phosphoethanolaminetransferase (alkaline phosphatase superfamily)